MAGNLKLEDPWKEPYGPQETDYNRINYDGTARKSSFDIIWSKRPGYIIYIQSKGT